MLWIGLALAAMGQTMAWGMRWLVREHASGNLTRNDVRYGKVAVYGIGFASITARLLTHVGLGLMLLYLGLAVLMRFK